MRLIADKQVIVRNKRVGTIKKNRTYITHRNKNHFFKKFCGFGLSASVLDELRKYEVETIKLVYTKEDKSQEIYITTTNKFYEQGVIYKYENDYQRILPLKHFVKIDTIV